MSAEESMVDSKPLENSPANSYDSNLIDISPKQNGAILKRLIKEGTGDITPTRSDTVHVHYVGRLLDGTIFDSSRDRRELFSFSLGLGEVIEGWDLAVQTMKANEISEFTIAPEYAYGEAGCPPKVPPNSTLIFEIELSNWTIEDLTRKQDGGVKRKILKAGTGYSNPSDTANVDVDIKGSYDGRIFDERNISFCLGEGFEHKLIEGIEIAIGKMRKDEISRVYIKPEYAWGKDPPAEYNIPSDYKEVIYEIHLKSFEKLKECWELTNEERVEYAEAAKEKGTHHFKLNNMELALKYYRKIPKLLAPISGKADPMGADEPVSDSQDPTDDNSDSKSNIKARRKMVLLSGYLNLSMVYLKLKKFHETVKTSTLALELDENNIKALFRRAVANQELQEYQSAVDDLKTLLKFEPSNKAAKDQLAISHNSLRLQIQKDKALYKTMLSGLGKDEIKDEQAHDVWKDLEDENKREFKVADVQDQLNSN